jgi:hypothetical protein
MIAFRLGLSVSRTASISRVSVFRDPAAPPKSRISAELFRALIWAVVFGSHRSGFRPVRTEELLFDVAASWVIDS